MTNNIKVNKKGGSIKMKTTKIMAVALASVLSVSALSACGSKSGEKGEVSLSVGDWPTNGDKVQIMENRKAEFEAKYPNIKILPDTWSFDLKTFYPKAEAGMLPDLFATFFTEFSKLTEGDYVEDMTEEMKANGLFENLNPKIKDLVSVDGKIYAMPTEAYALGLYCNIGLFEKAGLMEADGTPKQPKDWYELAEMAKTIKEKTGEAGFIFQTSNNCGGWIFTNVAWSFGVNFMKANDDGSWTATFDTPEAVEALQYIKDLKWKYDCIPSSVNVDLEESRKMYCTGKAAMTIDGLIEWTNKYEMNLDDFGMVAIPAGPKRHVALIGGKIATIAKGDDSKDKVGAALKWLSFNGTDYTVNDEQKAKMEEIFQDRLNKGTWVGVKTLSIWREDSENTKARNELIDKMCNINPNHVRLFNESLFDENIEFQPEEPMCAQDLYGLLDNVIQEVLTNKDADCDALIKKANEDFQKNYLDKFGV